MSQKRTWLKQGWEYLKTHQIVEDTRPFSHIDVGITAMSGGLGFDLATPICKWAQLRIGGEWRPFNTYTATFHMQDGGEQVATLTAKSSRFQELSNLMHTFTNTTPDTTVMMSGQLHFNNFKLLVDFYPIKKHRNFHVTVGFYYGNTTLIEANTIQSNLKTQAAINVFNDMYKKALGKESLLDIEDIAKKAGYTIDGSIAFANAIERLRRWGAQKTTDAEGNQTIYTYTNKYMGENIPTQVSNRVFSLNGISVGVGKFSKDVIAEEDIYYDYSVKLDNPYYIQQPNGEWREETYQRDANGNEIKKGGIRYHKGDVIYAAGEPVRMTPDENNQLSTIGQAYNKFRPYIGVGYTLPITRDKRTCLSVDAGVMFWGGHPAANIKIPVGVDENNNTVYHTIDLTEDITDTPETVTDYINSIKRYPVFPEIGIRISHRLW